MSAESIVRLERVNFKSSIVLGQASVLVQIGNRSASILFSIVQNRKSVIIGFPDLQVVDVVINCRNRTLQFPWALEVISVRWILIWRKW